AGIGPAVGVKDTFIVAGGHHGNDGSAISEGDLLDIIKAVVDNKLAQAQVQWSEKACVGVVMASAGYPGKYQTGFPISGLNEVDRDIMVFHAGTKEGPTPGEVVTNGGRVLTIVATGKDLIEAREKVYNNIVRIHFEGCQYRSDIAQIKNKGV
ncbi:MAG: hypothetical protein GH158_01650, partial [Dehalococcoidia bacterium]|nr:hypothetical protein [Dehalococcoidia bacterium]